jgi:hypothetical protein
MLKGLTGWFARRIDDGRFRKEFISAIARGGRVSPRVRLDDGDDARVQGKIRLIRDESRSNYPCRGVCCR